MATYSSFINGLYVVMYGRSADATGYNYWLGTQGISAAAAATTIIPAAAETALGNAFMTSQSTYFNSQYQSLTDTAFIQQLYNNLGGSSTNVSGSDMAYWQQQLVAAGENKAALAAQFTAAFIDYNGTDPAGLARQQTFMNKVAVSQDWVSVSGTAANSSLMNATSTTSAAFTAEQNVLVGMNNTAAALVTALAQINTAASAQSLTGVVGSPANYTAQTFTLTTGLDAPGTAAFATTSPAGNSIVYGTVNATGATLTPGDVISATGLNNTLSLSDGGLAATGTYALNVAGTVSGVQNLVINSGEAITFNAVTASAGFTGLTQITATTAGAGATTDSFTAAATTNVAVTDNATAATGALTIDGGLAVTLTETNTDSAAAKLLSNITIGGTTAPAGAVIVMATESVTTTNSASGNITINGGIAAVTVTSTVNDGIALVANAGAQAANKAGLITVADAATGAGAVIVNDALNVTSLATITTFADAVTVSGGSSTVTVNETVSTTQAATGVSSVTEGAVSVTGGSATTSVTVNQAAAATGALASAAVAAVAPVSAVLLEIAAPGIQAVTGVSAVTQVLAAAAVVGTATVVDAAVTIIDKNNATTTTASNHITTVALNNYGALSAITDNALSNLSLSGTGGTLNITNAATGVGLTNTTLNLTVNGLKGTDTIDDVNNEITTVNVTTGATKSSLAEFADSGLKTLNVAGSSVLTLGSVATETALATVAVTGAAGLTANLSGLGAVLTSLTTTSSGVMTLTLDDTTQTFVGSTGQDVISLAGDATKAITGGSATNNEVVLTAASSVYTALKTGANVTHFTTLGVSDATGGDVNAYNMGSIFTGYNAIDVIAGPSGAGSTAFTNVVTGTSLSIDASLAGTGNVAAVEGPIAASLLYQVANATGSSDSVNVSLGTATTTGIVVAGAMFEDANAVGVATLNVVSNGTIAVPNTVNTISLLIDNGLANLNVSGNEGLTIVTLTEATTQATAFAINNTSLGAVSITNFTDANLGSLTFAGTGASSIGTLTDSGHVVSITNNSSSAASVGTLTDTALNSLTFTGASAVDVGNLATSATGLTIANTGTGAVTVGDAAAGGFADASLTSLTLTGNVAIGLDTVAVLVPVPETATGATTGVTISGATDNAHVNISLTGALVAATDTITLGNGNDTIVDTSHATLATVNITVGTGANNILLGSGAVAADSVFNVTLGSHTNTAALYDLITVNNTAGANFATVANNVVTGATTGDHIAFGTDAAATLVGTGLTAGAGTLTATSLTAAVNVAAAIGLLETAVGSTAHGVAEGVYGGNTYIVESNTAAVASTTTTTVVELMGVHTLTGHTGALWLAS